MWIRSSAIAGMVVAFLAFASIAFAQEPTGPTYGGSGPDIDNQVGQGQVAGDVVTGTLPFTGLDLVLALVGGLALVAVGLVTRRLARARSVAR